MESRELITEVVNRMKELNVTQTQLAKLCGLSQPHLSKVLTSRIKLASKTKEKLRLWLDESSAAAETTADAVIRAIERKMKSVDPEHRMQIMQFLSAVVSFLDEQ